MKVSILTNNFPPCLDGVGDYSYHLANEFQRNGHQVSVLCRQDKTIQKAVENGQFSVLVSPSVPDWNWLAICPLRRFIRDQRPDWILVQYVPNGFQRWAMPIWLPVLLWLVKRKGVKVSITFHEVYVRMTYWPLKYRLVSVVQRIICTALTCTADKLITSIDLYARLLHKHTAKEVHLIPIGSNILPVTVTFNELQVIRKRIAPNGGAIISTFGLRNQDVLLQVFERLLKQDPNTSLLICSKLRLSDTCLELYNALKGRITVTGFMKSADVYRYLRASDVFFIPDHVTYFGKGGTCNKSTSLASGLLAGLPIVGTKGNVNNKLLSDVPSLYLGNYYDIDELTAMTISALKDSEGGRGNELFAQRALSWEVIGKSYVNLLTCSSPLYNGADAY
jgi:glycosyltransferase involved in cell wall biosynthesis